uniref:Uncharacterized protein n=1 Tax=Hirondellea gigas TaxID=1518452 RepID=A0A6A7G7P9_9CRUS
MDLQGQPIPGGPKSTKVTTDPQAYQQPISEPSGPVTNDSLAAESATHGGGFSENRGAEPLGVSGGQSTLNNTNTSGATKLPSASVGTQREDINRQERYPEALGGQGDFPGAHDGNGYVGGPTSAKQDFDFDPSQGGGASGNGYKSQYNAGQAPSYVSDVTGGLNHSKPQGKNLHEGGFDSDPKYNASFNSDIGSRNDPGRAGENKLQHRVAASGPDAGGGPRQKGVDDEHWYQPLERDQRA